MLDLVELQSRAASLAPDQRARLTTYVNEAIFFEKVLERSLQTLSPGAHVIEVGSGCGLLSMLVAQRGFRVTSFEPQLAGFGEMLLLRSILQESWVDGPPEVQWVDDVARQGKQEVSAEFGFSINVIEHVPNARVFMAGAMANIIPGGSLRIVCPNYIYPYESHFNMPTLFRKDLTERFLGKLITRQGMKDAEARLDPQGMWDALSWPTARSLRAAANSLGLKITFSHESMIGYFGRATNDREFRARKGQLFDSVVGLTARGLGAACIRMPSEWLPVLDFSLRTH